MPDLGSSQKEHALAEECGSALLDAAGRDRLPQVGARCSPGVVSVKVPECAIKPLYQSEGEKRRKPSNKFAR